jgi:hypothetical protein
VQADGSGRVGGGHAHHVGQAIPDAQELAHTVEQSDAAGAATEGDIAAQGIRVEALVDLAPGDLDAEVTAAKGRVEDDPTRAGFLDLVSAGMDRRRRGWAYRWVVMSPSTKVLSRAREPRMRAGRRDVTNVDRERQRARARWRWSDG